MRTAIRFLLTLSVLFVVGCSYVAPRYGLSPENLDQIKSLKASSDKRIAVAPFTSAEPGKQSISCRAAGPVEAPDGKSFEVYLRDVLISELKTSELFDEKSPTILQGHLERIDFSSSIGAGYWTIRIRFSTLAADQFTVEHTYPFSTNFMGDIACNQVAQALTPATQDFYKAVYNEPAFKKIFTNR